MTLLVFIAGIWMVVVAAATFAWSVVCAVAFGVFWIAIAVLSLCGVMFIVAAIRPNLFHSAKPRSATDLTHDTIRAALRSGELDADIARINLRNDSRRRR